MTVAARPTKISYSGNAVQTIWDYTFSIILPADVVVLLTDPTGVQTTLTSNYSVDQQNSRVVYPTVISALPPLPSGWTITLLRLEPLTQTLTLQNQAAFNAADIEGSLDKLTMKDQELQEQLDRSVKQSPSIAATNLILPTPVTGNLLGWDVNGNIVNIVPGNAGAGTMGPQAANNVAITGGSITGITDLAIADGGTGAGSAQVAINNLTDVANATNEHVLTKDTTTGNAIYKATATGLLTLSGSLAYLSSAAYSFLVGASVMIGSAKAAIVGMADQIQFIVRGFSTQTGNIFEVRKSDDTVAMGVSNTAGTQFGGTTAQIKDANGNELIKFGATGSAVNEITISNAATGNNATIAATGETNAGITISGTGTKGVLIGNAALETVITLADGATPALDASLGNIFVLTAAGDRTIAVPSNAVSGQKIIIRHKASGAIRTLSLNTGAGGFRFGSDITGLTATVSGKTDYIGCIYNSVDSFWDVVAYTKGF